MLVEGPSELKDAMRAFFKKHDYVILDGSAEHQFPLPDPVWDTVAVPKEKFAKRKSS